MVWISYWAIEGNEAVRITCVIGVKCRGVKDRLGFFVPCLPQTHMAFWYPSWHRKTISITVEITFIVILFMRVWG